MPSAGTGGLIGGQNRPIAGMLALAGIGVLLLSAAAWQLGGRQR
ncbi:MAG TPA: hypothetical protein VIU62_17655 [Chloroflexota bacterium]